MSRTNPPKLAPARFCNALLICGVSLLTSSCMSIQNQSGSASGPLDALQGAVKPQVFVEAYFEYPGPQEKWAGSPSFMMHITTQDVGDSGVAITPELLRISPDGNLRVPASKGTGMPSQDARARFVELGNAIQAGEQEFKGCLYPVRVRLIRGDGSLVAKQGCRGDSGWPQMTSALIGDFLASTQ